MATFYSVQKTKWDQNTPTEKIKTSENAGRIRVSYALYEASSTAAASTSITTVDIAATSALGRNTVVDADGDGIPITVVLAGGTGSGTIELTMHWVVD